MSLLSMMEGLTEASVEFVVIGGVAARAHGSTRITEDLDICYSRDPENVDRLARLLTSWGAYPRGIDRDLPFFMDAQTFRTTPVMTLMTVEGALDVFDEVKGVGDFESVRESSVIVDAGDFRFRALSLEGLLKAKRAAGRPKDIDQIPELKALIELSGSSGKT
jgi:predicted nucleotidyltransferase